MTRTLLSRVAWAVPLGAVLVVWPFGVALLALGWLPPGAGWVGGVLLGLQAAALIGWLAGGVGGGRALLVAGGIAGAAWVLEAVGVTTGLPFGPYRYSAALGPTLGPVPLAIPCAWIAVVGSAYFSFWILDFGFGIKGDSPHKQAKIQNLKSKIVGTAVLAAALDLLVEPVATRVQGYWTWLTPGGAVPLANYAAWAGAAGLLAALIYRLTAARLRTPPRPAWLPALLYGLNVAQFGIVDAAHGFTGPVLLAAGLLALLLVGIKFRGMGQPC